MRAWPPPIFGVGVEVVQAGAVGVVPAGYRSVRVEGGGIADGVEIDFGGVVGDELGHVVHIRKRHPGGSTVADLDIRVVGFDPELARRKRRVLGGELGGGATPLLLAFVLGDHQAITPAVN